MICLLVHITYARSSKTVPHLMLIWKNTVGMDISCFCKQELLTLREHLVLMGSLLLVFLAFCVVFFVLFFLVLCLVYSMLSVSLDFSFSIVPSVFSNVYLSKYCMNHLVIGS